MPLVEVTLLEGRTPDQKRALISGVTDAVEASIGAPRASIRVALRELPAAHWAIGGESIADIRAKEAGNG
ncbi:MAG: 2-hydroxymuconate tautomerase family protein [Donghicola eburneus]|nr:2-hydroxymuconate tautomerase [Donghicola eburneus]MCI5040860.1 2-hydroxymuconate tautomerase family protein [Donghicola eburneus]